MVKDIEAMEASLRDLRSLNNITIKVVGDIGEPSDKSAELSQQLFKQVFGENTTIHTMDEIIDYLHAGLIFSTAVNYVALKAIEDVINERKKDTEPRH